ncbi:MAG: hypothetical protein D6710_06385 [Nitrospirae bacterium]|nr:MAG: hypothetical protein D6710_06385 [Nitrospirota bacterium]
MIKMKRLFVSLMVLTALVSNAFAGGNLSLFNQTKKIVRQPEATEEKHEQKIKNLRRLTVEDLSSGSPAMLDEDDEEDPWDDGEDMGC